MCAATPQTVSVVVAIFSKKPHWWFINILIYLLQESVKPFPKQSWCRKDTMWERTLTSSQWVLPQSLTKELIRDAILPSHRESETIYYPPSPSSMVIFPAATQIMLIQILLPPKSRSQAPLGTMRKHGWPNQSKTPEALPPNSVQWGREELATNRVECKFFMVIMYAESKQWHHS